MLLSCLLFPWGPSFAGPCWGQSSKGTRGITGIAGPLTVASLSPGLGCPMVRYLFVKTQAVDFREDPANTAVPTTDQNPECVKLLE